jgi:glucosyl-3-phosphoglycerate synthase
LELLRRKGIDTAEEGKGRSCWLACGWLLAAGDCDVLALHDCDIRNYSRGLLARLCYPAAHPDLAFEYCKGYYARVAGRLHGRVTRLFVTPLVRALENLAPGSPFLQYLDSFRYPLAGEFAMRAALAGSCRFPADWGFEIGMLAEVYRRAGLDRVCQVELTDTYDHKHQPLSADDASRGLRRMTREIAVRLLAAMGTPNGLSKSVGGQLPGRYRRLAMDIVRRHSADARLNHLAFDPAAEEAAIHVFSESLAEALASYEHAPALIPSWDEVCRTVPEAFDLLRGCAEPLPAIPPPAPISWAVTAKAPAPIAPHGSHAYHRAR